MKELEIKLTEGLPGSGKSTWAKDFVKRNPKYKRINKDDLRAMLHDSVHSSTNENFIKATRDAIVKDALQKGFCVIIDDTNLDPSHRSRMEDIAKEHTEAFGVPVKVTIKDFKNVPIEECIRRDAQRSNTVGERVIRGMYNKYMRPEKEVNTTYDFDNFHTSGLPYCVIVDLDGTLAIPQGRPMFNPTDEQIASDALNEPLAVAVGHVASSSLFTPDIIFLSGRKDNVFDATVKWLKSKVPNLYKDGNLFMRKTGDDRNDAVVKMEMYDQHIAGKYNVLLVFDDRDRVVNMWRRDLKLPCFQVWYGDF